LSDGKVTTIFLIDQQKAKKLGFFLAAFKINAYLCITYYRRKNYGRITIMLQILGYILIIGVAIVVIKFGFALLIRCCIIGILAFLWVGAITGALTIFGKMSSDTAWTISKWAFYIGTAINIVEVLFHPFRAIRESWDAATDDSPSSPSSSSSYSDSNNGEDEYPGVRCCGNCRWNTSLYSSSVMCNHSSAGDYNGVMDSCSDYCQK
jgi:hypothetical protein